MNQKKYIKARAQVMVFVLGLSFQLIAAELHYPAYMMPLMIRLQDPISTAMGLTGVAYRSGSLSVLTNPAGLSFLNLTEVAGVHVPAQGQGLIPESRPQYLNQESLAAGLPFHGFVLGGMFLYYNMGSGSEGQEERSSTANFVRLYQASCSRQFTLNEDLFLTAGLNAKRIENRLTHKQGVGYSGDLGLKIHYLQDTRIFSAGLSASNLGPNLRYKYVLDTEYETPMQLLRAGVSGWFKNPMQWIRADLLATLEYQRNLNQNPRYFQNWEKLGAGVEAQLFSVLFIRMGGVLDLQSNENPDGIEGLTFGLGFHTEIPFESLPPLHLKLDYGRGLNISDLNQNMISLTLGYDLKNENLAGF